MKEYFLWLLKLLTLAVVFLFIIPLIIGAAATFVKRADSLTDGKNNAVAVVELKGEIKDVKEVIEELHRQVKNDKVKGIVLLIDSPGGAVGPSQELFHTVAALKSKKPIVASMSSVAASGGLYASLSASKVFAQPGTLTGSIGVIGQFPNVRNLAALVGVDVVTVKSGALKDVGNPFREMTPPEHEFLNSTMSSIHDQFINDVATARNIAPEQVRTFADGRVLTGLEAKKLGLVDELGGTHDAAREVFKLAGTPLSDSEEPELVYPTDHLSELKDLLSQASLFFDLVVGAPQLKLLLVR